MIIEDGTGIADANAFVTVAEFNTYATDRGIDPSDYDTEQIEGAIVVASYDFINFNYTFKGTPLTATQGMNIPTDLAPIDSIVKNATCAAALLHLKGRLFVDASEIDVSGGIKSTKDAVGSLLTEIEYKDNGGYTYKYPTSQIDAMLSVYTIGGSGSAPSTSLRF